MPSFRLALFFSLAGAFSLSAALWPQPQNATVGTAVLKLSNNFDISLVSSKGSSSNCPEDLAEAIKQAKYYLQNDKLPALTPDYGASQAQAIKQAPVLNRLTLQLSDGGSTESISELAIQPLDTRFYNEGYTIHVPNDGSDASIVSNTTLGLFRGLSTFTQLWFYLDGTTYSLQAPLQTIDAPAYRYRGFMLDTARNYFPVSDIKRTLDAMSWVKLNVFHWHIVDAQSFPLQIPGYEEIAQHAAYYQTKVYTPDDVKDVVSYAAARGIDVIAEVDTPGHTYAISRAHPEHIACAGATPWGDYSGEPPAGQIRIANPATQNFTSGLLSAASKLFASSYFGTGGDEINTHCYDTDSSTQADLTTQGLTIESALDKFTQATHGALRKAGKTAAVWEEMVVDHNVTLANDTLVWVWTTSDMAAAVTEQGKRVVHAPSNYFYLDCGQGGWVGDFTGNSWCDPFKSWQVAYSFDPLANITAENQHLIMGGQHLLWTEQSSPENLDTQVWPRAAVSAELFWTGSAQNVSDAVPRLHELVYRFRQRGVGAITIQPEWCARRPHVCDLTA